MYNSVARYRDKIYMRHIIIKMQVKEEIKIAVALEFLRFFLQVQHVAIRIKLGHAITRESPTG